MSKPRSINEAFIYLKVDDAFAVWFKASKSFLLLEEPAFFVLKLITNGIGLKKISEEFSNKYDYAIDEVKVFVEEVSDKFSKLLTPNKKEDRDSNQYEYNLDSIKFYSEKTYSIDEHNVHITYGDKELESVIHPLINHFEIFNPAGSKLQYFFFRQSGKLIFQIDKKIAEEFEINETGYLKAAFLLRMLSLLHGIKHENWMITLHASAVSDGKNAILFSAAAGSGKSTLAALLHSNGYNILSDDFLAMDSDKKQIYQLPVATTIKQGSFNVLLPYFPQLEKVSLEKAYTGKEVRYLPINTKLESRKGFQAKKLVFVKYSVEKQFSFNKIEKKKAIKTLLEETWINPEPNHVTEFFNWFEQAEFFEMEYWNISDALNVVQELFEE